MARKDRPGWEPAKLRQHREAHGLSLEAAGEELRKVATRQGFTVPAANFQTLWGHERGEIYPGPHYRRAYCLLYQATEADLGFRLPLPSEVNATTSAQTVDSNASRITIVEALKAMTEIGTSSSGLYEDLVERVSAAWWERRASATRAKPTLVLVGGYAGSGKTELARFLSRITGWAILDKDPMTRPLVEGLLRARGLDPNDRHSPEYLQHVRPLEYRCLMDTAYDNLDRGVSIIISAPLLSEYAHAEWLTRIARRCQDKQATVVPLWVRCDPDSMYEYISARSAARDGWKITNWDDYLNSIDLTTRPTGDHIVIDNTFGAAVSVADRTRAALQGSDVELP